MELRPASHNVNYRFVTNRQQQCDEDQCGLQSCKNRPAPFPGRMVYRVTKPGCVFSLSLSLDFLTAFVVLLTIDTFCFVLFSVI